MPAYIHFPGVLQTVSASYTLSHGITPGVAALDIAPQGSLIAVVGPLTFSDGSTTITFADCKVDRASLERNAGGKVVSLSLFDRRWKWRFPTINGHYNLRHPSGAVVNDGATPAQVIWQTEKTPQELAVLLLQAMGESGFDVSALPNFTRPEVQWDYDNAAQELAQLAEDLGCRVVLRLNGTVALARIGVGDSLPGSLSKIDATAAIDPPERPDALTVVTGRVRHQADLLLEAVGLEANGTIQKLDDLSYKPSGIHVNGWGDADLDQFAAVTGQKNMELARECVWKWYRPVVPFVLRSLEGGRIVSRTIDDLAQLQFGDKQVDEVLESDVPRTKDAQIWGVWYDGHLTYANVEAALHTISDFTTDYAKKAVYRRGFSIDAGRGLVKFNEHVFQRGADGKPQQAQLVLRTAVYVRWPDRSWVRHGRTLNFGPAFGTRPRVIKREDLLPYVRSDYPAGAYGGGPSGETSNVAEIDAAADYYLAAANQEYLIEAPQSATYAGLLSIGPDGAIQQVSWTIGPSGIVTRASRNNEGARNSLPYSTRRLFEKAKRTHEQVLRPDRRREAVSGLGF